MYSLMIILSFVIQVLWENRLHHSTPGSTHFVTVDGTDLRINETLPFSSKWYSHELHAAGVRYEVAVSIKEGHIIWVKGPFPCGEWPDIKIFRKYLKHALLPNEHVEADHGYSGEPEKIDTPDEPMAFSRETKKMLHSRHETENNRFKQWGCLSVCF